MAKSTCSTSSNSSYSSSSVQSAASSNRTTTSLSSGQSLGFKSVTDRRKRLAANARERKRMHLLNQAYDRLRKRLVDAENKSKYDVLVQAKEYIQALADMCEKMDKNADHIDPVSATPDIITTSEHHSSGLTLAASPAASQTSTVSYTSTPPTPQALVQPTPDQHLQTTYTQYHHPQHFEAHPQQQQHQQHYHHPEHQTMITSYNHTTVDYV